MDKKIISFLSQWRVIIPLSVVVFIWFLWPQPKATGPKKLITTKTASSTTTQTKPEVAITSLFGVKKKLRCAIESATAVIDDTKIAATITENKKSNRIVFDGDCLYRWIDGGSSGDRSCGLRSMLPFVSQFVSNDSLQKFFPKSSELTAACKEVSSVDQKVFEIPKSVLFKNKKLF